MVAAAALLAILDAVIVSAAPNPTRIAFALVVTLLVGAAILKIWLSNTRIEQSASGLPHDKTVGGKPAGPKPEKKRRAV